MNTKRRTYSFGGGTTGLAYAALGCGPSSAGANPNLGGGSPPTGTSFTAGVGKTLTNLHVELIFWGAWWNDNPLAAQVESGVKTILAGPYMCYLAQYGVRRGDVRGTTYAGDSEPGTFTYQDIGKFVQNLLDNDRLPEPDDEWPIVYAVIMPANSAFAGDPRIPGENPLPKGAVSQVAGANSRFTWNDYDIGDVDNDPAYYLWVGNDGTLDYITTTLSHELAEIATDPNGGDGIRQTAGATQAGGGQIGDVCTSWCDDDSGVRVQAYWSQLDGACALPKFYSLRRTLAGKNIGGKLPRPLPSLNAWIVGQF